MLARSLNDFSFVPAELYMAIGRIDSNAFMWVLPGKWTFSIVGGDVSITLSGLRSELKPIIMKSEKSTERF